MFYFSVMDVYCVRIIFKLFDRIFYMLADISSPVIFALLPANAIFMSVSMYDAEVVRTCYLSPLMIFHLIIDKQIFCIFHSLLHISRYQFYYLMYLAFFVLCFGQLLSLSLLLIRPIVFHQLAIWFTTPIGPICRQNCENSSF